MGIFEDIRGIIAEETQVPVDQVKENSNFESDLKADSLTQVELVMELEEKYDIEIPEEDLEKLQSVGDVVKYIEQALANK